MQNLTIYDNGFLMIKICGIGLCYCTTYKGAAGELLLHTCRLADIGEMHFSGQLISLSIF
jgi:hypothetical protein